jgi:hypothetical protein
MGECVPLSLQSRAMVLPTCWIKSVSQEEARPVAAGKQAAGTPSKTVTQLI